MDAKGFQFDIAQKPDLLQSLTTSTFDWSPTVGKQILFLGMGSSHFANLAIANLLNRYEMSSHLIRWPIPCQTASTSHQRGPSNRLSGLP